MILPAFFSSLRRHLAPILAAGITLLMFVAVLVSNIVLAQEAPTVAAACTGSRGTFWEQSAICANSVWQRPAYQFGASTSQTCNSGLKGMVQWTGTAASPNDKLQYCDGTEWKSIYTDPSAGASPASSGDGYFVLTATTYNGNLSGISGANSTCVTELTNNTWMGKTDATNRGMINSAQIKAFLCDGATCNPATASVRYYFALAGNASVGGGYFDTNSSGYGPGDSTAWSGATYFGSTYSFWSGRNTSQSSTLWAVAGAGTSNSGYNCNSWTSSSSGVGGYTGLTSGTDGTRWGSSSHTTCNNTLRLACIVNPTAPGTSCGFNSGTYSTAGYTTTLTVPAGCAVTFKAWGGGGGSGYPWTATYDAGVGGGGGYATITLSATGSAVTYYLGVGGGGSKPSACAGSGGSGGSSVTGFNGGTGGGGATCGAGGGGAATGVWTGGYGTTPVIVAGGGGGGGGTVSFAVGTNAGAGGAADSGGAATTAGANGGSSSGAGGGGYSTGGSSSGGARTGGRGGASYAASGGTTVAGSGATPGNSGDSNRPAGAGDGGDSVTAGGVGEAGTAGAIYYSY